MRNLTQVAGGRILVYGYTCDARCDRPIAPIEEKARENEGSCWTNVKRNDRFLRGTPKGTHARYARVHTQHGGTQQERSKNSNSVCSFISSIWPTSLPRILFPIRRTFGSVFVSSRFVTHVSCTYYVTFAQSNDNKALNL